MSDYLGANQTRVMDATNRSFESVIYQKRKPPLSSEVNLGGSVEAQRSQKNFQSITPSGWTAVGRIADNVSESLCNAGDVLCSPAFSANSFKLVALDKGLEAEKCTAWVNGWRVLIQGTGTLNPNENNIIVCSSPLDTKASVDFVFLEVWRKLVSPDDKVYKYGNVLYYGTPFANDLIDPAMGIETSLRIQTQYRIRVTNLTDTDFAAYPDGFSGEVYVQGPRDTPCSGCSQSTYRQAANDPGLWIAGSGNSVSQEELGTVDGYVYAVPMFFIRRRSKVHYNPPASLGAFSTSGSKHTLAEYLAGIASDRPDDTYQDWIVASDILDLRHKIPAGDLNNLCSEAFKRLQANRLPGKMSSSLFIGPVSETSYGSHITKRYTVSGSGSVGTVYRIGDDAYSETPVKFMEARHSTSADATYLPIAMKDQDIRVRYDAASPTYGCYPVVISDSTYFHTLRNRGGNYIEYSNFGHQMVYHTPGNGTSVITFPKTLFGYTILGIQNIVYDGVPVPSSDVFSVQRGGSDFEIIFNSTKDSDKDAEFVLYTASKFFEGNKQTSSITDCFEMLEVAISKVPGLVDATYVVNTPGKGIRAIGSSAYDSGLGFAYDGNELVKTLITNNNNEQFTQDSTCVTVKFSANPDGLLIHVPVLVRSYIGSGETFDFIYDTVPYQGKLDSSTTGTIEAAGPAITTSVGSGAVTDYTYSAGLASFGTSGVTVIGVGTEWLGHIRNESGIPNGEYLFCSDTDSTRRYAITEIVNDTELTLSSAPVRDSAGDESYKIVAKDQPAFNSVCILDRFPVLSASSGQLGESAILYHPGDSSVNGAPTIENGIVSRPQDILDFPPSDSTIGVYGAYRGRRTIHLSNAPLGLGNLGLNYEGLASDGTYKKTFQSYIFNRENSGKLYLMVVGSETDNMSDRNFFNPYSGSDVVDLFELPGRPLMRNSGLANFQKVQNVNKPTPEIQPIYP